MSGDFDPRLVQKFRGARRVVALTGAGISAESGIPTFRDAQTGLWARFRPEELATAAAFRRDPQARLGLVRVAPRPGCAGRRRTPATARSPGWRGSSPSSRSSPRTWTGSTARAGSRRVIELHGNIHRSKCFEEGVVVEGGVAAPDGPPRCPRCGAPLRPDVVWFGETLPPQALAAAEAAAQECDLLFSIGTSAAVFPAAQLPVTALQSGAMVVEINKDRTPLTGVATFSLLGQAGEILPRLLAATWPD